MSYFSRFFCPASTQPVEDGAPSMSVEKKSALGVGSGAALMLVGLGVEKASLIAAGVFGIAGALIVVGSIIYCLKNREPIQGTHYEALPRLRPSQLKAVEVVNVDLNATPYVSRLIDPPLDWQPPRRGSGLTMRG